jgi:magnesium-dependent phosphatase 1
LILSASVCAFQKSFVPRESRLLEHQPLSAFPSLIVFDLDNTIWTPELYQLRTHERSGTTPIAGKDVKLFEGSQAVVDAIRRGDYPSSTKFAVASRTKSVEWAQDLLDQFRLRELMDNVEIFPGNKRAHFANLKNASGVDYNQMLFFDDARDGKFGNCEPVSELGVLAVHCPAGLQNYAIFETGLRKFEEWNKLPSTIVEWDGSVTNPETDSTQRLEGVVKTANAEKRYGFIRYGDRSTTDVFFHFNNLPNDAHVEVGDKVSFTLARDLKNGKSFAKNMAIMSSINKERVVVRVFSMNLPFAALLANGYKTLETRNGTMFAPYPEGTLMLLHVGQRTYPDGDKHIHIMKRGGLTDLEVGKLKSLPKGFGRGMAVAICEIGKTYERTEAERSIPDFEQKVAAFGADSGRMVTEIKRVAYLKRPLQISGQGGVFKAEVDTSALPDGWDLRKPAAHIQETGAKQCPTPIYSISG